MYDNNRLAAITAGGGVRTDFARCTAVDDKTDPALAPAAFPYSFYGIALGAPRDKMIATFGPFRGSNNSHDFWNYWPGVALSIDGEDAVDALYFANSMAFAGVGNGAHYIANQDPVTCRIRGVRIVTDR